MDTARQQTSTACLWIQVIRGQEKGADERGKTDKETTGLISVREDDGEGRSNLHSIGAN